MYLRGRLHSHIILQSVLKRKGSRGEVPCVRLSFVLERGRIKKCHREEVEETSRPPHTNPYQFDPSSGPLMTELLSDGVSLVSITLYTSFTALTLPSACSLSLGILVRTCYRFEFQEPTHSGYRPVHPCEALLDVA
jgi:hypothetical protein